MIGVAANETVTSRKQPPLLLSSLEAASCRISVFHSVNLRLSLHATPIIRLFLLFSLPHLLIIPRPPPLRPLGCHISVVYSSECSLLSQLLLPRVYTLPRRNFPAGDRCHDIACSLATSNLPPSPPLLF